MYNGNSSFSAYIIKMTRDHKVYIVLLQKVQFLPEKHNPTLSKISLNIYLLGTGNDDYFDIFLNNLISS